jgi:hypothetical protein
MNVTTRHCMRHANFVGNQRVVYQLATSCETLAKEILVIPSSIAIYERRFSNKILLGATCELH